MLAMLISLCVTRGENPIHDDGDRYCSKEEVYFLIKGEMKFSCIVQQPYLYFN